MKGGTDARAVTSERRQVVVFNRKDVVAELFEPEECLHHRNVGKLGVQPLDLVAVKRKDDGQTLAQGFSICSRRTA
jgi:hypothetical protein